MVEPFLNKIKSNQIKSNQIKSNQIKSKSNWEGWKQNEKFQKDGNTSYQVFNKNRKVRLEHKSEPEQYKVSALYNTA